MRTMADPPRLSPTMVSRKLLILDFIRRYIAEWRQGPSLGEIAADQGISRPNVLKHVRTLTREGELVRRPGPRGIALPDRQQVAKEQLRADGWIVDDDALRAVPASALRVTDWQLHLIPELSHIPSPVRDAGDGRWREGQERVKKRRRRA